MNNGMSNPSMFMMQNTIVNSATKSINTGWWFLDMVVMIAVMSVVGSLFQYLPSFIAIVRDYVLDKVYKFKRRIINQQELVIKDVAYLSTKSTYVVRHEFRNTIHLVRAMEYYLNNQKNIKQIKMDLDNDGDGNNDYTKMKDHSMYYSSLDPITVLDNGITITYSKFLQKSNDAGGDTQMITTVKLKSYKSHAYLKEFVDKIYKEYVEKYFKRFDNDRQLHYYTLDVDKSYSALNTSDKSGRKQLSSWRRYDLDVKRTFDSLFFDEKNNTVALIDNFIKKKGMFSRESIPYKLSFLLHGPPGTGKTSFIKALASRTRRHIINVALPLIETNGQLLDIFHNPNIAFFDNWGKREDTIPLDKRIYILEDIDALSNIVKRRRDKKKEKEEQAKKLQEEFEKEAKSTPETDTKKDDTPQQSTSDNIPKAPDPSKVMMQVGPMSKRQMSMKYSSTYERYSLQSDELNLSGLLNALDGLMELSGAIVVLTTNFPEKLDPALIRPGRITKNLCMGYMSDASVKEMLNFYFDNEKDAIVIEDIDCGGIKRLTPAQLENVCLNVESPRFIQQELYKLNKE